jgi:hypothetical protein
MDERYVMNLLEIGNPAATLTPEVPQDPKARIIVGPLKDNMIAGMPLSDIKNVIDKSNPAWQHMFNDYGAGNPGRAAYVCSTPDLDVLAVAYSEFLYSKENQDDGYYPYRWHVVGIREGEVKGNYFYTTWNERGDPAVRAFFEEIHDAYQKSR